MIGWFKHNISRDLNAIKQVLRRKPKKPTGVETRKSEAEIFLESIPPGYRDKGKQMLASLYDINVISDPTIYGKKMAEFREFVSDAYVEKNKRAGIPLGGNLGGGNTSDLYGFKPSGSQLWSYFVNPFEVYAYVAQHHATVRICLDMIRAAMEEDGFYLTAAENVGEEELLRIHERLRELGIEELRLELAAHLKVYGNAWIKPVRVKKLRGIRKLQILYPGKLFPEHNPQTGKIERYVYTEGKNQYEYSPEQLFHLKLPSIETDQLGSPPLTSAIPKIETAFHAQNFNLTWFYKGGLIGHILSIEAPTDGQFTQSQSNSWVQSVQDQINYLYSGSTAGGGIAAFSNVKDLHKVTDTTTMDASWRYGDQMTSKTVSMLLGVPPEKVGIPRNESAQYQPELVENVINADFDRTMNSLTKRVDGHLNYIIRHHLGIPGVKIQSAGRYGAMTLNAAKTITELAKAGPLITVNQGLDRVLGWEPLPADEERGRVILDQSPPRKKKEGEEIIPPQLAPLREDPELTGSLDKIVKDKSRKSLRLQVGGINDGKLYRPENH